jgi:hypothetical protein
MSRLLRAIPALACKSNIYRTVMWFGGLVLMLVSAHPAARGLAENGLKKAAPNACSTSDIDIDGRNDIQSLQVYRAALRHLLAQAKFKQLDCIANTERSSKQRLPGGMWKIHEFYWAVTELPGHATQEDLKRQLKLVQNWVAVRPSSIAARIVLAKVYINYAWDARGNDTGDTVTESGWKLFGQRLEKAKAILDDASHLHSKCPEWYLTMQDVALGLGWDRPAAMDLMKQAITFEPEYYYYYRSLAYYLMPQWNGDAGEAAKFAEESSNQVGGDAGDILYFQIGEKIVCACNDPEYGHMSWPRLQKGYGLLETKYGASVLNLNRLALMATKSGDTVVADGAFQRIGDSWDKDVWITETYFNQSKATATAMGAAETRSRGILQEAAANLQSPGGAQYQKSMEQAMLPFLRQCVQTSSKDLATFELVVKVGKDGGADDAWFRQPTAMAQCMMRQIYDSHVRKETPFPVPPRPGYWLDLHLDPAAANVAASAN